MSDEVKVRKYGKKYRVVDSGTGAIAKVFASGKPRDGGGHKSKAKAMRQVGYINDALRAKGGES